MRKNVKLLIISHILLKALRNIKISILEAYLVLYYYEKLQNNSRNFKITI